MENYFAQTLSRIFNISGIDVSNNNPTRLFDSTEFCYASYPIIEIIKVLEGCDGKHHIKDIEYLCSKISRPCGKYTVNVLSYIGSPNKYLQFKLYPDQLPWIMITFGLRADNKLVVCDFKCNNVKNECYFENTHLALFMDAVYQLYDTLFTAIDYDYPLIKGDI